MRRRQALLPFSPFVGFNSFRYGAGPTAKFLAAAEIGDSYLCVEYQLGIDQVVTFAAKKDNFGSAFAKLDESTTDYAHELRRHALKSGATLEAIQLLRGIIPLTTIEEAVMAAAKLSRQTADKEALKTAAKANPVSGKKPTPAAEPPTKRKGNVEALAKARAARGPTPDRTYKATKKENGGREGTWTQRMIEIAQSNASTDDAKVELSKDKEHGERKIDWTWLEKQGYIANLK